MLCAIKTEHGYLTGSVENPTATLDRSAALWWQLPTAIRLAKAFHEQGLDCWVVAMKEQVVWSADSD